MYKNASRFFARNRSLAKHLPGSAAPPVSAIAARSKDRTFHCEYCKITVKPELYKRHIKKAHRDIANRTTKTSGSGQPKDRTLRCEYCKAKVKLGRYQNHIRKVHPNISSRTVETTGSSKLSEIRIVQKGERSCQGSQIKIFKADVKGANQPFNGVRLIPLGNKKDG